MHDDKSCSLLFLNKIIAPGTIPQLRSSEDLVRGAIFVLGKYRFYSASYFFTIILEF